MTRVITGLLALVVVGAVAACGGGAEAVPTNTPTATPIVGADVIDMSASNDGLEPQTFQLQLGTTYVIRFTNASASNTYRLIVERYGVNLEPLPGKNVVSDPFTESEAGEYPCLEFNRGALLTTFQCTLVFS